MKIFVFREDTPVPDAVFRAATLVITCVHPRADAQVHKNVCAEKISPPLGFYRVGGLLTEHVAVATDLSGDKAIPPPKKQGQHRIMLTTGRVLLVEESPSGLHLATETTDVPGDVDMYIARITKDGVLVMPNSGDAVAFITQGLDR